MKIFNLRVSLAAGSLLTVVSILLVSCGSGTSSSSILPPAPLAPVPQVTADVVVYSATPSGIMASIEAAHLGKKVVLLEPGQHVGGMSSSGLGATDLYSMNAIGGLVQTFFQTVKSVYGADGVPLPAGFANGTDYAPHIAEQAFNQMLGAQSSNITVVFGAGLSSISQTGTVINNVTMSNAVAYAAKEFIDASYEGDLMAAARISYTVGREALTQYWEPYAGVQDPKLMGEAIDPYVTPGDPSSGLIQHVMPDTLGAPGSADQSVMAYNYRLCLSTDPANQIPFTAPAGYNAAEFEVVARLIAAYENKGEIISLGTIVTQYQLPQDKIDVNATFYVSTDDVGASTAYPNASLSDRQQIAAAHKEYMQGLLYFLMTDPRIPSSIQADVRALGLCKDEFTDNGGWPRQLYIREARRMIGAYVMTQNDAQLKTSIEDSIGLGGYSLFDSHYCNRIARDGTLYVEGFPYSLRNHPYPIPYRILTPRASQAANLLVTVDVSASHVAYDSLRVEVTYMMMGQAAGAAASLAIDESANVQSVNYSQLKAQLLSDGQILTWTGAP